MRFFRDPDYRFKPLAVFLHVVGSLLSLSGIVLGLLSFYKSRQFGPGYWLLGAGFFVDLFAQQIRDYYRPSA